MNRKKNFTINIGFSSILMVFIMICLVTFSTLSVLTANSDYRLSKKMEEKTTAYYKADTIAKNTACIIDQYLISLYQNSSDSTSYYRSIDEELIKKELPDNVHSFSLSYAEEIPVISYQVTISTVQTLHVSLEIHYPQSENETFYEITQWCTKTSNIPLEDDTHLNLFGG